MAPLLVSLFPKIETVVSVFQLFAASTKINTSCNFSLYLASFVKSTYSECICRSFGIFCVYMSSADTESFIYSFPSHYSFFLLYFSAQGLQYIVEQRYSRYLVSRQVFTSYFHFIKSLQFLLMHPLDLRKFSLVSQFINLYLKGVEFCRSFLCIYRGHYIFFSFINYIKLSTLLS